MTKKHLIYQELQLRSISELLNQTDTYFYRKVCRWYSEKFHTPLHVVMENKEILWDDVLLHYYETQFEEIGYNQVYELACNGYVPELIEEYERNNEEFAKALEEEQRITIEKKKKHDKIKNQGNASVKKMEPTDTTIPSINLNFEGDDL